MAKLRVIYEPRGLAREYAALALNLYNGCTHGCIYCYNNGRYSKKGDFFKAARPRKFEMTDLARDCKTLNDQYGEEVPEVLISFIGDAYQPSEARTGRTRLAIRILTGAGIPFTILTKSDLIMRDFDLLEPYSHKFRLGVSLVTWDQSQACNWEPGASSTTERIALLAEAQFRKIPTWVSLEPVMDAKSAVDLIKKIFPLVDLWHIGKLNHMEPPAPIDWAEARREIEATLDQHHCIYVFKSSMNH